jgi:hypothetical protein
MTRFLGGLFATRTPRTTRPPRRVSLNVEMLETREVPSSTIAGNMNISQLSAEIAHLSAVTAASKSNSAFSHQQMLMQQMQQLQQLTQQMANLLAQLHNPHLTINIRS